MNREPFWYKNCLSEYKDSLYKIKMVMRLFYLNYGDSNTTKMVLWWSNGHPNISLYVCCIHLCIQIIRGHNLAMNINLCHYYQITTMYLCEYFLHLHLRPLMSYRILQTIFLILGILTYSSTRSDPCTALVLYKWMNYSYGCVKITGLNSKAFKNILAMRSMIGIIVKVINK